ncbi:LCP family glycopolymer transferase [Bacillus sp. UNC41MFS5]|uniref:LCP family glycopolymer transferase n=1 Tax=Bacillus sp. UNC41MFS5 TaxID=1449046 RepID=UPI00068B4F42
MNQPIDRKSEKREEPEAFKEKDPFSVVLLGVDERKGDRGSSDSLIVLTVNPTNNSLKMLSIPRDTRTEIVGKGKEDKVNHAYAFGGVSITKSQLPKKSQVKMIHLGLFGFCAIFDKTDYTIIQS